jgi:CDP-4-dehydro-6-deoxyglucose reductase, E3
MPTINYSENSFTLETGDTVLTCLERNECAPPSSCRSGVCQSCMMKSVAGDIPEASQKGLSPAQKESGYFLSCQCSPESDMEIADGNALTKGEAIITAIDMLNETVVRVRMVPTEDFEFRAGQFINIVGPNNAVRSYSIASVHGKHNFIELHVALMPGGIVSGWLHNDAKVGESITFYGPQGTCFYTDDAHERPLILAGTGTGLAPLYGILLDALERGHSGPIHLFHGSLMPNGLYLIDELRQIAENHPNVFYYPCALKEGDDERAIPAGAIDEIIMTTIPKSAGHRVYLCGHPDIVAQLQRKIFLAGASMSEIYADAFLPAGGTS